MLRYLIFLSVFTLGFAGTLFAKINLDYNINLNAVIDNSMNEFTAEILISTDENSADVTFNILPFTDIYIDNEPLRTKAGIVNIPINKGEIKKLTYKKSLTIEDVIKNDFVTISSLAPVALPDKNLIYNFNITMPKDYIAVMSNDSYSSNIVGNSLIYHFIFAYNLENIEIIASKNFVINERIVDNITIATYFDKTSATSSTEYLDYTERYITDYEKMLDSKYPYKKFSIIENILPTGYAMPTYTSISYKVLNMPFIKTTSLPHELLHQWFGVAIQIKDNSNWCEAITSYLSDHYYRESKNEDLQYRKNILYDYMLYVEDNDSNKLSNFKYNDSKLSQIIGYGRGAFLFHMIRVEQGSDLFLLGLNRFIRTYLYKSATWEDIIRSFNDKKYLQPIANFMLDSTKMIDITDVKSTLIIKNSEYNLSAEFIRKNGPANLTINYFIHDGEEIIKKTFDSKLGKNELNIILPSANAKVYIDENYDIFRTLTEDEIAVNFATFFATKDAIGVADNFTCDDSFKDLGITKIYQSSDVTLKILQSNNIVICSDANPIIRSMLAQKNIKPTADNISSYAIYQNPLANNNKKTILLINNPYENNVNRLKYYSNAKYIRFNGKKVEEKIMATATDGILVYERKSDKAISPTHSNNINDIIASLATAKAIFIGENHDNYAHHLNQLEIIKELYKKNKNIAVGFEMIQKQFQPELDKFINSELTEKEFLKAVEYYERWRFPYNLYAPIFKFLQKNKIPAIALNIDGNITRKIGRSGYDNLTKEEKTALPKELNLDNIKYYNELKNIYSMHSMKQDDNKRFNNFYLAQNIWDEVMAESLYNYAKLNPDKQLIVIAGGMHAKKDSGIPLRFERLSGEKTFVILQDDIVEKNTADIILLTESISLPNPPTLGVMLNDSNQQLLITAIDNNSVATKSKLKVGDIIMDCNMINVSDIVDLKYILNDLTDDDNIKCTVNRKGNIISIDINFNKEDDIN